ncbi:substrate-binding periplasmic protein [Thermodesulfobacteriota bacterium]
MNNVFMFIIAVVSVIFCWTGDRISAQERLEFSTIQDSIITPVLQQVVQEGYQQAGIEIKITEMPAQRSLLEANEGRVDGELVRTKFIEPISPNLIRIPVSIYLYKSMAFSKQKIRINGWRSLKPYKLGFLRGHKQVEEKLKGLTYKRVENSDQLFKMMDAERLDVVIIGRARGLRTIQQLNLEKIKVLEPPLSELNLYHYLHKRHQHLVSKMTKIFQKMEDNGRIKQINDQFEMSLRGKK